MATSLFDFDDVTTFGFAEDNNMIFTLDNVSKTNSKNYDDNADIDSASDNASESTIDGTTPDILSDEDGENASITSSTIPSWLTLIDNGNNTAKWLKRRLGRKLLNCLRARKFTICYLALTAGAGG